MSKSLKKFLKKHADGDQYYKPGLALERGREGAKKRGQAVVWRRCLRDRAGRGVGGGRGIRRSLLGGPGGGGHR